MNKYYNKLVIPVQVLNNPLDRATYSHKRFYDFEISNFTQEYKDWIKSLGLNLYRADMLYSEPNTEYPIHQDIIELDDFAKINFVYNGKDTEMHWYRAKREEILVPNIVDKHTELYNKMQVELLYSTKLQDANLVQAGMPHSVISGNEPRWCISTVYAVNKRFLTWSKALEVFKPYLVNE